MYKDYMQFSQLEENKGLNPKIIYSKFIEQLEDIKALKINLGALLRRITQIEGELTIEKTSSEYLSTEIIRLSHELGIKEQDIILLGKEKENLQKQLSIQKDYSNCDRCFEEVHNVSLTGSKHCVNCVEELRKSELLKDPNYNLCLTCAKVFPIAELTPVKYYNSPKDLCVTCYQILGNYHKLDLSLPHDMPPLDKYEVEHIKEELERLEDLFNKEEY